MSSLKLLNVLLTKTIELKNLFLVLYLNSFLLTSSVFNEFTYNNTVHLQKTINKTKILKTTYKVKEKIFNPTDSIAFEWKGNRKIKNENDVPPIVALHPVRAKVLGIKPMQPITFILKNGQKVIRYYCDKMKHKGKWDSINWDRVDFLINKNEPFVTEEVTMFW